MNRRPQKGTRVGKSSYARHVSQLLAIAFGLLATLVLGVAPSAAAAPSLTVGPISEVRYTTAHVSGTIDPEGVGRPIPYYFEYSNNPAGEGWPYYVFGGELSEAEAQGSAPIAVAAELTGLQPGAGYTVRLTVLSEGEVSTPEPNPTFTTLAAATPNVTISAPDMITATGAHFAGTVDPNAPEPAPTSGEVEATFEVHWHFQCTPACPGLAGTLAADNSSHAVSAVAGGLEPGTEYEVSLIAENAGGEATKASAGPELFATPAAPPAVSAATASGISGTEATLHAEVNPGGSPTSVHFEYLSEAQFQAEGGYAGPQVIATAVTPIGGGGETREVSTAIFGLVPGTTYHYRALATNSSAGNPVVVGPDRTFIAFSGIQFPPAESCPNEAARAATGSLALPECRAYEQVSIPDKNGFPITLVSQTHDGGFLNAESIGAFADSTAPSNCGLQHYALDLSPSGWTTRAFGDASPSFAYAGVVCSGFPLAVNGASLSTLHPAGGSVWERTLYRRSSDGSLAAIGSMVPAGAIPPTPTGNGQQGERSIEQFLGIDSTATHVLFTLESFSSEGVGSELWPGDTTVPGPRRGFNSSLYEYTGTDSDAPALVGVDNSGALISDCGTYLGGAGQASEGRHHNAISADGLRVFFTARGGDSNFGCEGVPGIPPVDELFARTDGAQTTAISEPDSLVPAVPDRDCVTPECEENTTLPKNFRGANFEGAAADGGRVFFTSTQQLLDGASQDPAAEDSAVEEGISHGCQRTSGPNGCNLYEYDFQRPEGERLAVLSAGDTSGLGPQVQGVAAVAEDGSRVYFVARGVLATAANTHGERPRPGDENLYVVPAGTHQITFVATLNEADSIQWNTREEGRNGRSGLMETTDDGQFLVFTTSEHLTPDDTASVPQVFRYDAGTGALVRVSIGEQGFNENGNVADGETFLPRATIEAREAAPIDWHPAITDNGQLVVFESSVALTPKALDDRCAKQFEGECVELAQNAYAYRDGHLSLISNGRDRTPNAGVAVSPSGENIYLQSNEQLTSTDQDSVADIYDARIDGGTSGASAAACKEEACQPQGASPAPTAAPASAEFSGPGNPRKPKHKKHRRHKKKHRGHGKQHNAKRRSGTNRGGGK